MTALVAQDEIEQIVGKPRSRYEHWGRIVGSESSGYRFHILHSMVCLGIHQDLRLCPFSKALDEVWRNRRDFPENVAMRLRLVNDELAPA